MSVFLFLTWLLFLSAAVSPSQSYLSGTSLHIDCGSPTDSTDRFNTTWLSDRFYTGGSTAIVSEPLRFSHPQEKTLRFFPLSSGKKNCYAVPGLAAGRYYVRTFTVYDNYDGKSHAPSFDASVEGTLVFSWRSPWPEDLAATGAYSDLFAYVSDGQADVCFYSVATDPPAIGTLEIVHVDPESYGGGKGHVLVNYGRLTMGTDSWGPGFSNDSDLFGRSWQSDSEFRSPATKSSARVVSTKSAIVAGTEQSPNYFPMKLFQTAVVAGDDGVLEYGLPVDAKLDYMLWLHFAELDSSVKRAGERVFDVAINGEIVSRIDLFKEVGGFFAYSWNYTARNLSSTVLTIRLVTVAGAALICGLENYALVPVDLATVPEQVTAMKALKESLRIPDRMGWNGDPCAPTSWDAWEGVTCHVNNGTSLYISEIDLASQGLKGYISDCISLLSNLVSLNLSSNSLGGSLPAGLGQKTLTRLDLSHNQFTGSIPESLTTSSLQLVILNNNLLEGRVPEELYSIAVHGGAIDLYDNKGLCGVPPLLECPLFWENGGLSAKGKIAVGISTALIFCLVMLVVYIFCIRRGRNDYDFGLPQDLMSLYAKRNRYQRQKSLMILEMESQHAKAMMPLPKLLAEF